MINFTVIQISDKPFHKVWGVLKEGHRLAMRFSTKKDAVRFVEAQKARIESERKAYQASLPNATKA